MSFTQINIIIIFNFKSQIPLRVLTELEVKTWVSVREVDLLCGLLLVMK